MKTPRSAKFGRLILLAGTVGFTVCLSQAQSPYQRFMKGDGCPFCSGGAQGRYGDLSADVPVPDALKRETTAPTPVTVPSVAATPDIKPVAPVVTSATVSTPAASVPAVVTAIVPPSQPKQPELPIKLSADGYREVDFGQLASYAFEAPAMDAAPKPGSVDQIPEKIQELDGKPIRMSGFMMPMKVEQGLATDFLIMRTTLACCYGMMPAPNEWVRVKVPGKGVAIRMDVPLVFTGKLHVGQVYEENLFTGVYRLDVEKIAVN